jgi:hypothetical protein
MPDVAAWRLGHPVPSDRLPKNDAAVFRLRRHPIHAGGQFRLDLATNSTALLGQFFGDVDAVEAEAVRPKDVVAEAVAVDRSIRPAAPISVGKLLELGAIKPKRIPRRIVITGLGLGN